MLNRLPNAVSVTGLSVAYRDHFVLRDVNWELPQQTLQAILGPNGAGKSTLLKAVLGLVRCRQGTIRVLGEAPSSQKRRIAYVPQRTTVDWDFPTTVADVVAMGTYGELGWFRRPGREQWRRIGEALEQVGMTDLARRQIRELSGGQQQRTFLARALVQQAELYFLDEPLQGVDMITERTIIDLLQSLRDQGKTIAVVHHDLNTVRDYFDSVTLLNGRMVASGPIDQVFNAGTISEAYGGRTPKGLF